MASKRALVTGSSRGIGLAVARRLADAGWSIALHGSMDSEDLRAAAEALGEACSGVYVADFSDPAQARPLWSRVVADGPLDALVNNAGIYRQIHFRNSTDDEFDSAFDESYRVNVLAPLRLTRCATRHFAERGGGSVVQIASRVGHRGEAGASCYSLTKAALINLTRALAVEQAADNIRHFAIAPGWVETAMAREGIGDRLPQILADIPLGRMATPEDCAALVEFLLKPDASYLSGVVIDVNGASYLR